MNQDRYIPVISCGTCPNKVGMIAYGGNSGVYPSGIRVSRCALTGDDISFCPTPDNCPLKIAGDPIKPPKSL